MEQGSEEDFLQIKEKSIEEEEDKKEYVSCMICYEDIELTNVFKIGSDYHDICMECLKSYMEE